MRNVDGDYDEIVRWMNENPVRPVGFHAYHGHTSDGLINVGLFSINEDHGDHCVTCSSDNATTKAHVCDFGEQRVVLDLTTTVDPVVRVEDANNTHMIRF